MTNKWCEYQNALYPVSLSKGFGNLMRLLLNHLVASVNAMAMLITIKIPVTPSAPLASFAYEGLFPPKSSLRYALYCSSDEFTSLGKSQTRWFPAWRITPITIAAAMVCMCVRNIKSMQFTISN